MPQPTGATDPQLRAVLDSAPVMIWASGPDGGCTYFNRGWLAYTGRTLEEEQGDGWANGVHADDLARCMTIYLDHFARRAPFRMEYRLRRADGEYGWVLDDGVPRYDENGAFLGFIGSCVDITDQKRAERVLRSETVTKELARRIISDLIGRARLPAAAVRAFGRSLASHDPGASTPGAFCEAFDAMGFGRLSVMAADGKRFEFVGVDLLERRQAAGAPMCDLTLGFVEGAVASITGRPSLGSEMTCQSMGHKECRFVVIAP